MKPPNLKGHYKFIMTCKYKYMMMRDYKSIVSHKYQGEFVQAFNGHKT